MNRAERRKQERLVGKRATLNRLVKPMPKVSGAGKNPPKFFKLVDISTQDERDAQWARYLKAIEAYAQTCSKSLTKQRSARRLKREKGLKRQAKGITSWTREDFAKEA